MLDFPAYRAAARRSYVEQDPALQGVLARTLAPEWRTWLAPRLDAVGARAATAWADLAVVANQHGPTLRTHTPWGDRIDQVEVHPAYAQLAREVYEAGVVWPRFNPVLGGRPAPWALVFAIGYVMSQAEQGLFCPVCLTAGTAWLLERFASPELKAEYLPRVASPDYGTLMEGAMFLTERAGGSDVGALTTRAVQADGTWKLYGDKWFSSNGGRAGGAMVLARPDGGPAGTRGVGLFFVPSELPDGTRNAIRLHRLKDKLGTRSMPSAELSFEGAVAYPVGDVSQGFLAMAEMLNLSRIYNAVASIANMRRTLNEAIAYTHARSAFGQVIDGYPLVQAKLIELAVEQEACCRLVFEAIALLDQQEARRRAEHPAAGADRPEAAGSDARADAVLRVLTPIIKYHTGREAVDAASAAAELLGGNGYIEEWPIARFLRDAQVLPIWEGTTNILLLDVLRAQGKERAADALLVDLGRRLAGPFAPELASLREALAAEVADMEPHLAAIGQREAAAQAVQIKPWADRAVRAMQGALLLAAAEADLAAGQGRGLLVLASFVRRHYAAGTWRARLAGPDPHVGFAAIVRGEAIDGAGASAMLREASPAPAGR